MNPLYSSTSSFLTYAISLITLSIPRAALALARFGPSVFFQASISAFCLAGPHECHTSGHILGVLVEPSVRLVNLPAIHSSVRLAGLGFRIVKIVLPVQLSVSSSSSLLLSPQTSSIWPSAIESMSVRVVLIQSMNFIGTGGVSLGSEVSMSLRSYKCLRADTCTLMI